MKKRLERLIQDVRDQTHTQDFSSTEGITNDNMVRYFNYASKVLRGLIYGAGFDQWISTENVDIVAAQESYSIPTRSYVGTNVLNVEYKYGNDTGEYRKLHRATLHNRDTTYQGTPLEYIQHGSNILINPIPGSSITNGLRITYEPRIRDVDIRRGQIQSTSGSPITSITLDLTPSLDKDSGLTTAATDELDDADYICIVDRDGNILMDDIPIDDYDSSTGVITITSGFTPDAGETSPVGAYVVVGDYASSHPDFPDFCEPYLINYVKYMVLRHNGHPDVYLAQQELLSQQELIIDVFSQANDDIQNIGIIDQDHNLM